MDFFEKKIEKLKYLDFLICFTWQPDLAVDIYNTFEMLLNLEIRLSYNFFNDLGVVAKITSQSTSNCSV